MEALTSLIYGFGVLADPMNIFYMFLGVFLGVLIGSMMPNYPPLDMIEQQRKLRQRVRRANSLQIC